MSVGLPRLGGSEVIPSPLMWVVIPTALLLLLCCVKTDRSRSAENPRLSLALGFSSIRVNGDSESSA